MKSPKKAPEATKVMGINQPVSLGLIRRALLIQLKPHEKNPNPNNQPRLKACFGVLVLFNRNKSDVKTGKRRYQW